MLAMGIVTCLCVRRAGPNRCSLSLPITDHSPSHLWLIQPIVFCCTWHVSWAPQGWVDGPVLSAFVFVVEPGLVFAAHSWSVMSSSQTKSKSQRSKGKPKSTPKIKCWGATNRDDQCPLLSPQPQHELYQWQRGPRGATSTTSELSHNRRNLFYSAYAEDRTKIEWTMLWQYQVHWHRLGQS